jgi:hypothetical protein
MTGDISSFLNKQHFFYYQIHIGISGWVIRFVKRCIEYLVWHCADAENEAGPQNVGVFLANQYSKGR